MLLFCGSDKDPFQSVPEWWNNGDNSYAAPSQHLFSLMGMPQNVGEGNYKVGKGTVCMMRHDPKEFILNENGDAGYISTLTGLYEKQAKGGALKFKNNYLLQRGPYTLAAVVDESVSDEPLTLKGKYIDMFDHTLPMKDEVTVTPNTQVMLLDVAKVKDGKKAQVLAASFRESDEKRKKLDLERAMNELSVTEKEAENFREAEKEFQSFVTGKRKAMAVLREEIGGRVMYPQKWIDRYEDSNAINRVQIYEDRGEGCREAESYFVRDAYQGENLIVFDIKVGAGVKRLRIDPAFASCSVKIQEITLNGERVPLEKRKVLTANGRILSSAGKGENYCPSMVFPTNDPNFCIALDRLKIGEENELHVRMEIVRLPISMAQDMANGR